MTVVGVVGDVGVGIVVTVGAGVLVIDGEGVGDGVLVNGVADNLGVGVGTSMVEVGVAVPVLVPGVGGQGFSGVTMKSPWARCACTTEGFATSICTHGLLSLCVL